MRSAMTREYMESRRIAAALDFAAGMRQADVARKHGVSPMTVTRWYRRWIGGYGMERTKATGAPARLNPDQVAEIRALYFRVGRWTSRELAELIAERFGVVYDQDHVGRLMIKWGLRERRPRTEIGR